MSETPESKPVTRAIGLMALVQANSADDLPTDPAVVGMHLSQALPDEWLAPPEPGGFTIVELGTANPGYPYADADVEVRRERIRRTYENLTCDDSFELDDLLDDAEDQRFLLTQISSTTGLAYMALCSSPDDASLYMGSDEGAEDWLESELLDLDTDQVMQAEVHFVTKWSSPKPVQARVSA